MFLKKLFYYSAGLILCVTLLLTIFCSSADDATRPEDETPLAPGEVKGAGFDLSAATADAIKSGYLGVVFDQQLWYQAYLTVQQVCFSRAYGFAGVYTDTGSGFVDASNIDLVHPLVMEGIR